MFFMEIRTIGLYTIAALAVHLIVVAGGPGTDAAQPVSPTVKKHPSDKRQRWLS
jgi:hypothetical protein